MKKIIATIFSVCSFLLANAATNITTPTVSGHWTMAGSPYKIFNNITVGTGLTLEIDPGVQILFQGNYHLEVLGRLLAVGTATQNIDFTVGDTTGWEGDPIHSVGGWHGMQFPPSSSSSNNSILKYCNLSYAKFVDSDLYSGYSDLYLLYARQSLTVENCSFFKNKSLCGALCLVTVYTSSFTFSDSYSIDINDCSFYDNIAKSVIIESYQSKGPIKITNSRIFNNNARYIVLGENLKLYFENNDVFGNISEQGIINTISYPNLFVTQAYIRGNKVHDNTMLTTASISCASGKIFMEKNIICNNKNTLGAGCLEWQGGAGVRCWYEDSSVPTKFIISNNIIANNNAHDMGAGIMICNGNADVISNTIVNNSAPKGPGISFFHGMFYSAPTVIKNNLFYHNVNTSSVQGNVGGEIGNEILYENNWTEYPISTDVNVNLATINGTVSTNVIGTNPMLVAPTLTADVNESALAANFSLSASSPCINNGSVCSNMGYSDYANNYRIFGTSIDIGAYEYGSNPFPLNAPISSSVKPLSLSVYPNPASNSLVISTPEANGTIQLLDISGRQVVEQTVSTMATTFDIQHIARGVYLATWSNSEGDVQVQRVVVE